MSAWIEELEAVPPDIARTEISTPTLKCAAVGWGSDLLAHLGFMPFSFMSNYAVVWIAPTAKACGRNFQLRRDCVRLGREYLLAQRWQLYAEIMPGDKVGHTFARVFGFRDVGLIHDRLAMELPKWHSPSQQ